MFDVTPVMLWLQGAIYFSARLVCPGCFILRQLGQATDIEVLLFRVTGIDRLKRLAYTMVSNSQ